MKQITRVLAIGTIVLMSFVSCKKSENSGFSSKITDIISVDMINNLRQRGMIIHEGTNPPNNISGIYYVSPYTLLSPWGPQDGWIPGTVITDEKYRLYSQSGDEILLDYKNLNNTEVESGVGTFISGSGNSFTIFAKLYGVTNGIPNTEVNVISGEITANGIQNFQQALVLTQKTGDDYNTVLIPVGASRIWYDGDGLSESISYY
jgi:hypothetical protein